MSASIIAPLVISGSRKVDGTANASGKVWAYLPDTSTPAQLYSDPEGTTVVTQPIVLDQGGRIPTATAPDGVFTSIPIRLYIEDADAVTVSDSLFTPATATNTTLDNEFWDGPTEDDAWTALGTSVGGTNGRYKESGGATERTIREKFSEIWISVKDFGAIGNGIAIDTAAVQSAANRIVALGGGVVYFPPGAYLIDQGIAVSNVSGIRFVGAAARASNIVLNHGTANALTLTSCPDSSVEHLEIKHTSTTTGAQIAAVSCSRFRVIDVYGLSAGYAYGIDHSGTTSSFIENTKVLGSTRAIRYNTSSTIANNLIAGALSSAGAHIEYNGSARGNVIGVSFVDASGVGILFNAALTGTGFNISHNHGLAATATPLDIDTAADPRIRQWGNQLDGYTASFATGTTQTPNWALGTSIYFNASSGGAGVVTVDPPVPTPSALDHGRILTLRLRNAAGGAVTWTMDAIYVLVPAGAPVAPAGTDGTSTIIEFQWDGATSEWRERFRSNTTT